MNIGKLANVFKLLSGHELSPQEYNDLKKEALVMTLSRATSQDTRIDPVEVATVRRKVQELTGEDISDADIRVAAHSELYETTPFRTCLTRLAQQLKPNDRASILHSLADVLKSDARVHAEEAAFFDDIAEALNVRPSQIAGLGE